MFILELSSMVFLVLLHKGSCLWKRQWFDQMNTSMDWFRLITGRAKIIRICVSYRICWESALIKDEPVLFLYIVNVKILANHRQWIKSYEKFDLTINPHKGFRPFLLPGIDFHFLFWIILVLWYAVVYVLIPYRISTWREVYI